MKRISGKKALEIAEEYLKEQIEDLFEFKVSDGVPDWVCWDQLPKREEVWWITYRPRSGPAFWEGEEFYIAVSKRTGKRIRFKEEG